jgi:apolipoprotein N-acyltransferase
MTSELPLRYENKYLLIDNIGKLVYSYLKHEPVPGEPAVKGRGKLEVSTIEGTNLGGAICYDYDFPYLAKEYGKIGADIIALPSSDWRGIDPLHTRMASFRALEQGHSILRSTRFGLSAGITPYGEMTNKMSSFDTNDKIMMAQLPVKKVNTLYSLWGDLFVYLCALLFILPFILNDGKDHWNISKNTILYQSNKKRSQNSSDLTD